MCTCGSTINLHVRAWMQSVQSVVWPYTSLAHTAILDWNAFDVYQCKSELVCSMCVEEF